MLDDVIAALRNGRVAEALALAVSHATAAPDDPEAYRLLAAAQAASGDLPAAHASLDRAFALSPDDAGLHYQRATLLVGERRAEDARSELAQSVALDSNELRAYLLQAQLALWDRDVARAEQQLQLAAKVQPDHPGVLTLRGLVLLEQGRPKEASALLVQAMSRAPENPQTRYTLGLAFLAQGHAAFAEQAFARVLERIPGMHAVRILLAEAIRQQDRPADAADTIEAGFASGHAPPADMLRLAGELRLAAGQDARALTLLRRGAAAAPEDRRLLDALIVALRRQGDAADARQTLETALAAAPGIDGLWSARLSFEPGDGDLIGISERWEQAVPHSLPAMQLRMWLADRAGDREMAKGYADRIVARDPRHFEAHVQIIHSLFLDDPPAAVAHIETLLPQVSDERTLRMMLGWLGRAQDRSGRPAEAVETWARITAIADPLAIDLPVSSGAEGGPATMAERSSDQGPVFLYGPPGSGVERVVGTLYQALPQRMRMDRMDGAPPDDLLQAHDSALRLASGELSAPAVAATWRVALPSRKAAAATVIDWLPWWDQALMPVVGDAVADASLWLVLADPRDMLLDWLQRGGTYRRYKVQSHLAMADWLAGVLRQMASAIADNPVSVRVLRVDETVDDAVALATQVSVLVGTTLPPLQALGPARFPAGHWRRYAEVLAEPFARLTPVAKALGYPET